MFRDKNKKISSKRICGALLLLTGVFIGVFVTIKDRTNLMSVTPLVSAFIIPGCALLGVTLAERKETNEEC